MRFRLFVASLLVAAFVVPALAIAGEGEATKAKPKRPSMKDFFKKLDKNNDGALTLDELPAKAKERGAKRFKMKDADKDGKVTFEEFSKRIHRGPAMSPGKKGPGKKRPGMKAPDFGKLFNKLDADEDGTLTKEEFAKGMKAVHKSKMKKYAKMGKGPRGQGQRRPPR